MDCVLYFDPSRFSLVAIMPFCQGLCASDSFKPSDKVTVIAIGAHDLALLASDLTVESFPAGRKSTPATEERARSGFLQLARIASRFQLPTNERKQEDDR